MDSLRLLAPRSGRGVRGGPTGLAAPLRGAYLRANPRAPPPSPGAGPPRRRVGRSGARVSGDPRAERRRARRLRELERRWDACGFGGPGASGGCSCAPRTPAQVTHGGRQGSAREKRMWAGPCSWDRWDRWTLARGQRGASLDQSTCGAGLTETDRGRGSDCSEFIRVAWESLSLTFSPQVTC